MDWFALILLWFGGLNLFGALAAFLLGDMQFATGAAIFAVVLLACGALAKGASILGDSVEGHAAKKPKTRNETIFIRGAWLAYFGGAVIYTWGKPLGFVLLALWLYTAYNFLRFLRSNEFHSGDLITLKWEGWFHDARVIERVDGGYLVRVFTERSAERPGSVLPATLWQLEQAGRSTVVNLAAEYLELCEPKLIFEGDLSQNDLNEIARFTTNSANAQGYA